MQDERKMHKKQNFVILTYVKMKLCVINKEYIVI
jgi:hypothetical protein